MTASAFRRSPASTGTMSRTSNSPTRCRSPAPTAENSSRRPRLPRTASSTSRIPGACSIRSMPPPEMSGASCGAWTPSRTGRSPIAARRCGAISSFRRRAGRHASLPPTRARARSYGKRTSPMPSGSPSPGRRFPSGTRSLSGPRAATPAPATGWRRSTLRPASCCGENTRFPRRASPEARPGRTKTTHGAPAAAPYG